MCDPIQLVVWHDAHIEQHGQPADSSYVEWFWLPIIGPTAFCILRRFTAYLEGQHHTQVDLDEIAAQLGLSTQNGTQSPFHRAMHRLVMFGLAKSDTPFSTTVFHVRTTVPTVSLRHRNKWSTEFQQHHDNVIADLYPMAAANAK